MAKLLSDAHALRLASVKDHLRTPLYRNGYALIVSTGITSVLGLLYWAVAARFYDTEHVGLNSMAISVMIFLSGVSQVNLQETMIRFIPQAGARTLRMVAYAYGVVIVISVLVGLIFCLGVSLWAPALEFLTSTPGAIAWFIAAIVCWGIFVIEDSVLVGLRQALWIPVENAFFSLTKIAVLILLATSFPRNGIFISWTASVAAVILPVNLLLFAHILPRYRQAAPTSTIPVRQITKYVAGNYAAALLANLSTALLPVFITQIAGATANAHFYLSWVVAGSLQIIAANMATSLTVESANHYDQADRYRQRALIGIARLLVPLVIVLWVGAPLILQLIGPSYVEEGVWLLRLLALAAIPNMYNMVYVATARVQNRMSGVIGVYGANALLVLGLSVLLLPSVGITGVGWAWLISQTAIALVLAVHRFLHQKREV